jgi:hypothetical protein
MQTPKLAWQQYCHVHQTLTLSSIFDFNLLVKLKVKFQCCFSKGLACTNFIGRPNMGAAMQGYQADMDVEQRYTGQILRIYEEHGRTIASWRAGRELRRFFGGITAGIVCWRAVWGLDRAACMHCVAEKQPPLPVLRSNSVRSSLRARAGAVPGR